MSKTIVIDAGHGGKDPGAVAGRFRESEINLKVALAAMAYLKKYDCTVVLTRTADTGMTIAQRTAKAKAVGAAALVSIHHNAGGGDGCEAFYWHTDTAAKELAGEIINSFKALGQNSRGVKTSSEKGYNFGMCRINARNRIPAVLAEFAFLDNAEDRRIIDSDEKLKAEGEAYGQALVRYLKPALKKVQAPAPPIPTTPSSAGTVSLAAGAKVRLSKAGLYVSSSAAAPVRKISGGYWLYDGLLILNRYRLTNAVVNVGKKPLGLHVTGWVNKGDVRLG
ncbi:MAG TPA: N-acetylmuramoyl-L-alanine amidase [Clostridia bacterium]|nr:N-acetylmuramoyl-L-alanine amidase [Clostridia bacterium]